MLFMEARSHTFYENTCECAVAAEFRNGPASQARKGCASSPISCYRTNAAADSMPFAS